MQHIFTREPEQSNELDREIERCILIRGSGLIGMRLVDSICQLPTYHVQCLYLLQSKRRDPPGVHFISTLNFKCHNNPSDIPSPYTSSVNKVSFFSFFSSFL
jgi:hypothetical protein